MTTFACHLPNNSGQVTVSDEPLGRGGEGSVYSVVSHTVSSLPKASEMVAKIYHEPNRDRGQKLVAMVRNVPETDSVAWPLALIVGSNKQVVGFLMKKLDTESYRMWAELAHTQQRRHSSANFDVRYALTTSLNLAIALQEIHATNNFVGDINESNLFIANDASVFLVDTDSAQVQGKDKVFPCLVGKPEYTAAELTHGPLKNQKRTAESDTFGYAVAIYQLLLGGPHPTDGIYQGDDDPPSTVDSIRAGVFPNLSSTKMMKPVPRIASSALPSRLRPVLLKALSPNPIERASLSGFEEVLDDILDNLTQCSKVKQHWYDKRDRKCGWCAHAKSGQPDPWSAKAAVNKKKSSQRKLKPVSFKEEQKATAKAPRRSVNAGNQAAQTSATAPQLGRNSPQQNRNNSAARGNLKPLSQVYSSQRIEMEKLRGKTVLSYGDGTQRQRPPLSVVASSNSRLAWDCFVNELPEPLRLSFPMKNKLPSATGLFAGIAVIVLVSFGWWNLMIELFSMIPTFPYKAQIGFYATVAGCVSAVLFPLIKIFNTFMEIRKARQVAGTFDDVMKSTPVSTALQLGLSSVMYGPPFLLAALFGTISFVSSANKR